MRAKMKFFHPLVHIVPYLLVQFVLCGFSFCGTTVTTSIVLPVSAGWNPSSSTGFSLTDPSVPYPCPVDTPQPISGSVMRYVDVTRGSDSNDGLSTSTAWKSIQRSVSSTASPVTPKGATVQVRAGVYNEMVTVGVGGTSSTLPLLLQSYPGEVAIIDGTTITVPNYDSAGITVTVPNVIVAGFEIRNFNTTNVNATPAGIRVTAANVTIVNNYIHHISNAGTTSGANAHGLAVYAATSTEATALTGIILAGNEIAYNTLGQSETCVINGNVEGFQILRNFIHDNNNIGIDAVGFEGTSTNAALDQARGGLIQGNVVYNISAASNPGYAGSLGADGIYLDGATGTVVDHNIVFQCDIGIEMASEHKSRSTSNSSMTNNIVFRSLMQGLSVGGYSASVGFSSNITIANNVAWNDDTTNTGSGELCLQYNPTLVKVTNNVFVASSQGVFTSSPLASGTGNSFDYNTYLTSSSSSTNGISLAYNAKSYTTFAAWKTATAFDSHSTLTQGSNAPLCGSSTGVQCVNGVPIMPGYTTAVGAPLSTCPSLTISSSSSTGGVAPLIQSSSSSSTGVAQSSGGGAQGSSSGVAQSSSGVTRSSSGVAQSSSSSSVAQSSSGVAQSSSGVSRSSSGLPLSSTGSSAIGSSTGVRSSSAIASVSTASTSSSSSSPSSSSSSWSSAVAAQSSTAITSSSTAAISISSSSSSTSPSSSSSSSSAGSESSPSSSSSTSSSASSSSSTGSSVSPSDGGVAYQLSLEFNLPSSAFTAAFLNQFQTDVASALAIQSVTRVHVVSFAPVIAQQNLKTSSTRSLNNKINAIWRMMVGRLSAESIRSAASTEGGIVTDAGTANSTSITELVFQILPPLLSNPSDISAASAASVFALAITSTNPPAPIQALFQPGGILASVQRSATPQLVPVTQCTDGSYQSTCPAPESSGSSSFVGSSAFWGVVIGCGAAVLILIFVAAYFACRSRDGSDSREFTGGVELQDERALQINPAFIDQNHRTQYK